MAFLSKDNSRHCNTVISVVGVEGSDVGDESTSLEVVILDCNNNRQLEDGAGF
jgi:hypothetical protein